MNQEDAHPETDAVAAPLSRPRFDPDAEEARVRKIWGGLKDFRRPGGSSRGTLAVLLEPLGLEGPIRMGTSLGAVRADILTRFKRMQGRDVLLVAGFHHAGMHPRQSPPPLPAEPPISGQSSEEAASPRLDGQGRVAADIADQLRRLGITFDARRVYDSMDPSTGRVVNEAFRRFFEEGLIYRQKKLVTWCRHCKAILSAGEIDSVKEEGDLWTVRYPIEGEVDKYLTVATSEPETIPGDCALLVSPEDEKYEEVLQGKVTNPLTREEIPVVGDEEVDPRGGTGVRRVTPGRSPRDFEKAKTLDLEAATLYGTDGRIAEGAKAFQGLDVGEARREAVAALEKGGFLERHQKHPLEITRCAHCGHPVSYLTAVQWFLRMRPVVRRAVEAVHNGAMDFSPKRWKKSFLTWSEGVSDWCISRYNVPGHRIAVSFCRRCGKSRPGPAEGPPCESCGETRFRPGKDVVDPWFSAVLAPLAALGWPRAGQEETLLPAHALFSGQSRFSSWTARFLAVATALTTIPAVRTIHIHGRIVPEGGATPDAEANDAIDPRDIIKRSGADAVRLGLAELPSGFQDIHLMHERFDISRNFVNKCWNAARFTARHFTATGGGDLGRGPAPEDRWILQQLGSVTRTMTLALEAMDTGAAAEAAVDFLRHDFSDWYIEMAKHRMRAGQRVSPARQTLGRVLFTLLRVLHPLVPFVTESIWRQLVGSAQRGRKTYPLVWAPWPSESENPPDPLLEEKIEILKDVARAVRSIRTKYRLPRTDAISVAVSFLDRGGRDALHGMEGLLKSLLNADDVNLGVHLSKPSSCATEVLGNFQVFVPLEDRPHDRSEIQRLRRRKEKLEDELLRVQGPLKSLEFVGKAPKEVRNRLQRKKDLLSAQIEHLHENIEDLEKQLDPKST